jgi:hypothetical protein
VVLPLAIGGAPLRRLPVRATDEVAETHDRIRHDGVDKSGAVTLRVAEPAPPHRHQPNPQGGSTSSCSSADLEGRVVNAVTGELSRELTIDPDKGPPPTNPEMTNTRTHVSVGPGVRDVLRHHTGGGGGI